MTVSSLTDVHAALKTLFADLAGITSDSSGEAYTGFRYPSAAEGAEIDFRIAGVTSLGQDELQMEYDPDAEIEGDTYAGEGAPLGGIVYRIAGQRVFLCDVLIKSTRLDVNARSLISRMCTRLRLPSALIRLRDVGLSLNSVGEIHDLSGPGDDHRMVSRYAVEIKLNGAVLESDEPVTTIETVEFETEAESG